MLAPARSAAWRPHTPDNRQDDSGGELHSSRHWGSSASQPSTEWPTMAAAICSGVTSEGAPRPGRRCRADCRPRAGQVVPHGSHSHDFFLFRCARSIHIGPPKSPPETSSGIIRSVLEWKTIDRMSAEMCRTASNVGRKRCMTDAFYQNSRNDPRPSGSTVVAMVPPSGYPVADGSTMRVVCGCRRCRCGRSPSEQRSRPRGRRRRWSGSGGPGSDRGRGCRRSRLSGTSALRRAGRLRTSPLFTRCTKNPPLSGATLLSLQ